MKLIETTLRQNDTVTLKLVGGDEIIARFNSFDENHIKITRPMLVAMAREGFGLVPYILTMPPDSMLEINLKHVITYVKTFSKIAKEYTRQTSGIITP